MKDKKLEIYKETLANLNSLYSSHRDHSIKRKYLTTHFNNAVEDYNNRHLSLFRRVFNMVGNMSEERAKAAQTIETMKSDHIADITRSLLINALMNALTSARKEHVKQDQEKQTTSDNNSPDKEIISYRYINTVINSLKQDIERENRVCDDALEVIRGNKNKMNNTL